MGNGIGEDGKGKVEGGEKERGCLRAKDGFSGEFYFRFFLSESLNRTAKYRTEHKKSENTSKSHMETVKTQAFTSQSRCNNRLFHEHFHHETHSKIVLPHPHPKWKKHWGVRDDERLIKPNRFHWEGDFYC